MSNEISKQIQLFDKQLTVNSSEDDWIFLCNNRFFTDRPEPELVQAEFITGTGITATRTALWKDADRLFHDYIDDLKEICNGVSHFFEK